MPPETKQARAIMVVAIVFVAIVAVLFTLPVENDNGEAPPPGGLHLDTSPENLKADNLRGEVEDCISMLDSEDPAERLAAAQKLARLGGDADKCAQIRGMDGALRQQLLEALSHGMADPELAEHCRKAYDAFAPEPAAGVTDPP